MTHHRPSEVPLTSIPSLRTIPAEEPRWCHGSIGGCPSPSASEERLLVASLALGLGRPFKVEFHLGGPMKKLLVLFMLGTGGFCAVLGGGSRAGMAQDKPNQDQPGVETLLRGPVHEAYAAPQSLDPKPSPIVPKQPPEPIPEMPPDQKPEGSHVVWISGYWAWDDDQAQYVWVSGFWRDLPPGKRWIPGHWGQLDNGWQWTTGFW